MSGRIEIAAVPGLPEAGEGDRVGELIAHAAAAVGRQLADDDIVVFSQKVVSKAEGRVRSLADVAPGEPARDLAARLGKDPRFVELVLSESERVVRAERDVLIVATRSGLVCANAGIDASNVPGKEMVALLPTDPDASARRIRREAAQAGGANPAIVIADSFGRPWRLGQAEVAIGCAGIIPLDDWRGRVDAHGRELRATVVAVADHLAAAADLVRDKTSRSPAVVIRGAAHWVTSDDGPGAAALRRGEADDLFR